MNDRQDPHGEQQFYGYDAYGRPVYHDPYAQQAQAGQYEAYDPYAAGPEPGDTGQQPAQPPAPAPQPRSGHHGAYDPYQQREYPGDYGQPPGYGGGPGYGQQPAYGQDGYGAQHPYEPQDPGSYGHDAYGQQQGYGAPPVQPQWPTGQLSYGTGVVEPESYGSPTGAIYREPTYAPPTPQPHQPQPYEPQPSYEAPSYDGQQPHDPRASQQTYEGQGRPPRQRQPQGLPAADVPDEGPTLPGQRGGSADADNEKPHVERGEDGEEGYRTEQFSFIEEEDEETEDVIDWLKFTESRTERREEARRRGRQRIIALVVALTVALAGGVGYLWYAGKLPGLSAEENAEASAADTRHVVVVHLREADSGEISTALLVNNETAGKGSMVLLPNSLALTGEDGTPTTLGKSFGSDGAGATRDALDALLGANIEGTWRLDTPYLENLVDLVGGITIAADATVPGEGKGDKPFTRKGVSQELTGQGATAYATYRAQDEPQTKQLARFGQVMEQVLGQISSDKETATGTVESLGQILDFSLTEAELGAALANLAVHAKEGEYDTQLLPVEANGTLSEKTAQGLVKEALGGSVKNADPEGAVRLTVRNASGQRGAADGAGVTLVNGGFTVVSTGAADSSVARSTVTYSQAAHADQAKEAAKTLGLPAKAVKKGEGAANADVTVVLGEDYSG